MRCFVKFSIPVLLISFALIACGESATIANNGSTPTGSTPTGSTPTGSIPTDLTPKMWQTTHSYSGNGSKKTETFTVGNDWKIESSCTPSSSSGIGYNVTISVIKSDATSFASATINLTCNGGYAHGETRGSGGGNIYLDIVSEGDWSVTVQELK
jgi:hypothetical protein